jgi:hypothetical protein
MPVPAADGLTDFGAVSGKALVPVGEREAEASEAVPPAQPEDNAQTTEPDLYAEGFKAGRDEALAELQALQDEFDARVRDELDRARQDWAEAQGGLAGQEIAVQFSEAKVHVREWVGETAKVMLEGPARERAIDDLHRVIAHMIERAVAVKAYGPEDMLCALRTRLSGEVGNLTCTPQPHGELRVEVDRTVVETTAGAWLESWSRAKT